MMNDESIKEFEEQGKIVVIKDDKGRVIYKTAEKFCNGCNSLNTNHNPYDHDTLNDPLIAYCKKCKRQITDFYCEGEMLKCPEWCPNK